MARSVIPFGDWRPDVATLDNDFTTIAENVYPGANAFLPMPSLSNTTATSLGTGNDVYTKVLLHMDGADAATSFPDNNFGGSSHTWTAAGNAQVDTAQSVFGGASLLLDGTGDWITTADSTDYTLSSSDFTIDLWVRPAVDGTLLNIAGQGDNAAAAVTTPWYIQRNASNKIVVGFSNGSAFASFTSTTSVVAGSWWHIAFVRTGSTFNLHINGTLEATVGPLSITLPDTSNDLRIGAQGEVTTTPWNGWIDEFRLSRGVARWTATFSVPGQFYDSVRGMFMARTTAGANVLFIGTATKLYKRIITTGVQTDVTRTSGQYNLAARDFWTFDQFGANVYATHVNDTLQSIDATSGTNFAAVSGSPPQAAHVKTVGDFLVLSGLSSNKNKIQWSAINDPTGWTVGTSLSDEQTFPDLGDVMGIAGDTVGIVVQESGLRTMQFLPGDTDRIFAFSKVENQRGATGKLAFTYTNNTLFFRSSDGFYAWNGALQPIGADAVNRWAPANVLGFSTRPAEIFVFAAPDAPRIFFVAHSASLSTDYNRLLVYDFNENKWSYSTQTCQMLGIGASSSAIKMVAGFNDQGVYSNLDQTNQAATIDTAERHLNPGMRSFVSNVYPLARTSAAVTITPYTREDLNDSFTTGTATTLESGTGWASILSGARIHKFRIGIAAGTWTDASGLIIEHQPDGEA